MDGYDPIKKKYVSVWVDSMSAAPMIFEGEYDAAGKTLTMFSDSPTPDGKPARWKSITKIINDDEHVFEMLITPTGGKESSLMVITYKRDK